MKIAPSLGRICRRTGLFALCLRPLGRRIRQTAPAHCAGAVKQRYNADDHQRDHGIVFPRELFLQENAAPDDRRHAVRGNDRRCKRDVRRVGQRENICELTGRFKGRAEIFGRFLLCDQLLLPDQHDVHEAADRREEERQLIGAVGRRGGVIAAFVQRCERARVQRLLAEALQNERVRKRSRRVEQAVGHRQADRQPRFGIAVVRRLLTRAAQLVVLARFHNAEADHADTDQRDRADDRPAHRTLNGVIQRPGQQAEHRHQRTGGIADRRGDGQLNVTQADIAKRHGQNVQNRDGQIGENDVPRHLRSVHEDLKRRVQAHDHADGDDHFIMGEFVLTAAADLGKQIRAAPA